MTLHDVIKFDGVAAKFHTLELDTNPGTETAVI